MSQPYIQRVKQLQGILPGVTYLYQYMIHPEWKLGPTDPRLSLLEIDGSTKAWSDISLMPLNDRVKSVNEAMQRTSACKFYFLEGITPDLIALFGSKYDIPPQFFAKHLIADTWNAEPTYLGNSDAEYPFWISENVPPLPSEVKRQAYFQFRYLDIRLDGGTPIERQQGDSEPALAPSNPFTKECNHRMPSFKRQVTVWYSKGSNGWIGRCYEWYPMKTFANLVQRSSFVRASLYT